MNLLNSLYQFIDHQEEGEALVIRGSPFLQVCCRDAKLVVLDWDELQGSLHTSSLHFWEHNSGVNRGRPLAPPLGPQVATDPQACCTTLTQQWFLALFSDLEDAF